MRGITLAMAAGEVIDRDKVNDTAKIIKLYNKLQSISTLDQILFAPPREFFSQQLSAGGFAL